MTKTRVLNDLKEKMNFCKFAIFHPNAPQVAPFLVEEVTNNSMSLQIGGEAFFNDRQ